VKVKYVLPVFLIIPVIAIIFLNSYRLTEIHRKNSIEKSFEKPLYLNLEDSSRSITLADIGITYDKSKDDVNINSFKLDSYLSELEREYEFLSKNTIISFEDFSFRVPSDNAKIKLDRTPFSSKEAVLQFIENPVMKMKLNLDTTDTPQTQNMKTGELVNKISTPLLIKYGRNPVHIPSDIIKSFVEIKEQDGLISGFINFEFISEYLNNLNNK
jgi:hypothetical protein